MNTNLQSTIYVENVVTLKTKKKSLITRSSTPLKPKLDTVQTFTSKVGELCTEHKNNKKWILIINSEESAISTLQHQQTVDTSKILHINNRKVKVNAKNIETALTKGNCSAIILGENNFHTEQLNYLHHCAKRSNTTLVLLDKVSGLH